MTTDLVSRLEEGLAQIVTFLPQIAAALGILLAGYVIAKAVERATDAALHRIGFDRWMREGGVSEALERTGTGFGPSTVIAKLIFWAVMLLVILLVANALGLAVVSSLFAQMLSYIPNVIAAVIILFLGLVLGEFVKNLILASGGAVHGVPTLARIAKSVVIILAIFMALEQLNIAEDIVLVAFIAVMGAAALAAGIAFGLGGREIAAEITRSWYERSRLPDRGAHRDGDAAHEPQAPPSASPASDGTGGTPVDVAPSTPDDR
jgi:Mechanosensitive ion channel, conserved TM helix